MQFLISRRRLLASVGGLGLAALAPPVPTAIAALAPRFDAVLSADGKPIFAPLRRLYDRRGWKADGQSRVPVTLKTACQNVVGLPVP